MLGFKELSLARGTFISLILFYTNSWGHQKEWVQNRFPSAMEDPEAGETAPPRQVFTDKAHEVNVLFLGKPWRDCTKFTENMSFSNGSDPRTPVPQGSCWILDAIQAATYWTSELQLSCTATRKASPIPSD